MHSMLRLLFLGALLAAADPMLLYVIYRLWGGWAMLGVLVIPPLIGGTLVSMAAARVDAGAVTGQQPMPEALGHRILLTAARILFWYPGPVSTLLALLLLVPGVRRVLQTWAAKGLLKAVQSGSVSVFPGGQGVVFTSVSGGLGGATGPLKRAEGTVVDSSTDVRALPENREQEAASPEEEIGDCP
jgi:UPF0716 family protein affecting phage T7 exclusion